jgi:TRAP-type C4-dicarboxylate transport system permease small subunit
MKKLDYLTRVIEAIVAVLMAGVTILTFVQVVRRFVFGAVFPWAEELAIYSMIWITFFGAVLCLRHGEHTRIDAFLLVLPHKIRKWIEVFDYVLCFAFMMLMSYHSIALLKMTGKLLSTAARLPMYYVYSALLVSGVLMIPYFVVLIYQKVMEKEAPKAPSTTDD